MTVLITGGAGYIGSNVAAAVLASGRQVVILDDLSNSVGRAVSHLRDLTGHSVPHVVADARDQDKVTQVIDAWQVTDVIHLAAAKSISDSIGNPLGYYSRNVGSLTSTLRAAHLARVKSFIFASSAAVYGLASHGIEENATHPVTPYGWTKVMGEQILQDFSAAFPDCNVVAFRYFNPVGAHESGRLGDYSSNRDGLMIAALDVGRGSRRTLNVYGDDWPTEDGTGERDYVHVSDIADAHVLALDALPGFHLYNLGTGRASSVLRVAQAVRDASGQPIPLNLMPRRQGDVGQSYCDPTRAQRELGWVARRTLDDAARHAWLAH